MSPERLHQSVLSERVTSARMRERVIDLIQKPPADRSQHQIDEVIPWLKKTSELLRALKLDVLTAIVRNCDYMKAGRDHVTIRQGDRGDCLYIILRGSVSVYIDTKMSGEEDSGSSSSGTKSPENKGERRRSTVWNQLNRIPFGKFIIKFDAGKCFGEIALISEDAIRNASIITDETTDYLVVDRELYNHTIKSYQEQEFLQRRNLARKSPLFSQWSRQSQRLLEMSLIREVYGFGQVLVKQGQPWKGLIFIKSGRARVTVQPEKHSTQYPNMCPFMTERDMVDIELGQENKKNRNKLQHARRSVRQHRVHVRRLDGYAAAEQHMRMSNLNVCDVGSGDVIGDIEAVMHMPTYMHTIECIVATEVYVLTTKNYERLLQKKNPKTINFLKTMVEAKIENRIGNLQGNQVPLLQHIACVLKETNRPPSRPHTPPEGSIALPGRDIMYKQLISLFIQNRAELIEPYVPGAIYYLHTMREKARIRESVRKHQHEYVARKPVWHTKQRKYPRSVKQLKMALGEQFVEPHGYIGDNTFSRLRAFEGDGRIHGNIGDNTSDNLNLPPISPDYHPVMTGDTHIMDLPSDISTDSVKEGAEGTTDGGDITGFTKLPPLVQNQMKPEPVPELIKERMKTFITELNADEIRSNPEEMTLEKERTIISEIRAPRARSITPSGEYDRIQSVSLNTVEEQVGKTGKYRGSVVDCEGLRGGIRGDDDWECSDQSLECLETRIRQFHAQHEQTKPTGRFLLPKLKRFESKKDQHPHDGGHVLVRRRICPLAQSKLKVVNHEHMRYHIVPSLPQHERHNKPRQSLP